MLLDSQTAKIIELRKQLEKYEPRAAEKADDKIRTEEQKITDIDNRLKVLENMDNDGQLTAKIDEDMFNRKSENEDEFKAYHQACLAPSIHMRLLLIHHCVFTVSERQVCQGSGTLSDFKDEDDDFDYDGSDDF